MTLAAAVAATLAAGTARVRTSRLADDGTALQDLTGVVDLRARRCLVEGHPTPAFAEHVEQLSATVADRWPWLAEAMGPDRDHTPMAIYEAGTAGWHRHGGRWSLMRRGDTAADTWPPTSGLWIIDRLTRVTDPVGTFRADDCEGEVRVSGAGLIESVVWARRERSRSRSPIPAFDTRTWRAVTLWDHGQPVTFDVPHLDQPSAIRTFAQAARALHRARKAYG